MITSEHKNAFGHHQSLQESLVENSNGLYPEYNTHNEVQITKKWANWILTESSGVLRARAVKKGCSDTFYGDKYHLLKLLSEGAMSFDSFTEKGLEYMSGLYAVKHTSDDDTFIVKLHFA